METLSWERLGEHLHKSAPALLDMGGSLGVQIGFDPNSGRLFLRAPLEAGALVPASSYAELVLEARHAGAGEVLEVSTSSAHLYPEFHRLAGLFTEELERVGQTAVGAFLAVAERWRELTAARRLLSSEQQLGLFGELAVLQALIREHGPDAVSSWTARVGEIPERHDFRVGNADLEVKSTRMALRHHVIHGLRQLDPSEGHTLFLISLKFEAAGLRNGSSLVDRVRSLRSLLSGDAQALVGFEQRLAAVGYQDSDAAHYQDRLIAADIPMLIPVDANCPRLVRSTIREAIGIEPASRIQADVTYRIDLENMGTPLADDRTSGAIGPLVVE